MRHFKTYAKKTNRGKWQGIDISKKPDMATYEILYEVIAADVPQTIEELRDAVRPNLPWADDHFAERVSGLPLNPGVQWAKWPWGHSADNFRLDPASVGDPGTERVFDHTYMQRYWPRKAGGADGHRGIYFDYGDLAGVVDELAHDPGTRQAVLPVFFPEDTGYRPGRRKPCSLFYHFQKDGANLDVVYYLRSCDIVRHYRDDIYLTVRLLYWVLDELRKQSRHWYAVKPGKLVMMIGNLHCFANDWGTIS
jgi:hypothetical protein